MENVKLMTTSTETANKKRHERIRKSITAHTCANVLKSNKKNKIGGTTDFSGGSRISPRWCANIRFCRIFPKTAWNWKNLDPEGKGGHVSEILLCRSATGFTSWWIRLTKLMTCPHVWPTNGATNYNKMSYMLFHVILQIIDKKRRSFYILLLIEWFNNKRQLFLSTSDKFDKKCGVAWSRGRVLQPAVWVGEQGVSINFILPISPA